MIILGLSILLFIMVFIPLFTTGIFVMVKAFNWVAKLTSQLFRWLVFGTIKKKERYY